MGKQAALAKVGADSKARKMALAQMNDELRKEFEEIANEVQEQADSNVWFYHKIGGRAARVHADTQKYGEGAVEKISAALVIDRGLIYKAMQFVQLFSEQEVEALMERRTAGGTPITWSHIAQLVHVADKKQVDQVIEVIFNKDLSIRELRDELKKRIYSGGAGGRQVAPRTVMGGMSQFITMGTKLNQKFISEFDDLILGPLQDMEPGAVTEDMIKRVADAEDVLSSLADESAKKAKEMEKLRGKLVSDKAKAQKAADKEVTAAQKTKPQAQSDKKPAGKVVPARKRERRPVTA